VYNSFGRDRLADYFLVRVRKRVELGVRTLAGVYRPVGGYSLVARHRLVGGRSRAGVYRPVGGSLAVPSLGSFQPSHGWGDRLLNPSGS
jgi:hypothetical protein